MSSPTPTPQAPAPEPDPTTTTVDTTDPTPGDDPARPGVNPYVGNPNYVPPGQTSTTVPTAGANDETMASLLGITVEEWRAMSFAEQQTALVQWATGSGSDEEKVKKIDPTVASGKETYFRIWGVKPPWHYIEGLVDSGLNAPEIATNELSKLGPQGGIQAMTTNYWRDRQAGYAATLARLLGRR